MGINLWNDFALCLDREDLVDDPRFATLVPALEDVETLRAIIDDVFPSRTTEEWEQRLRSAGQRYGRVKTYEEVVSDDTNLANGYIVQVEHPTYGSISVVGNPIGMSETPTRVGVVAPELGEHTEEVLLEAGFSWEEIDQMRTDGAY